MRLMRKSVYVFLQIVGFFGAAASILSWFGITPEMVGDAAYSVLCILLPILSFAFGFLAGWSTRALRFFSRYQVDGKIVKLTKEQAKVVDMLRRGVIFDRPSPHEYDILCQLQNRGIAEQRGGIYGNPPGWRLR